MLLLLLSVALAGSPDGRWAIRSDLASVRAAQQASVKQATRELPSVLLPIAERILAPALNICSGYQIQTTAGLSVQCDGHQQINLATDGVIREVVVGGTTRPISASRDGDAAILTIHSDEGVRTTRYAPLPDGGLRVTLTVTSTHLAAPITWFVDYAAKP